MPSLTVQSSLFAALLFVLVSSQPVYKLTNQVARSTVGLRLADGAGNPTRAGLIVHAIVFFAAMYAYGRMNGI